MSTSIVSLLHSSAHPSILEAMIIASARLSVAFDWGLEASFSLPQLVIGDCNFVGLVLAWLIASQPKLCLHFRSLFGYRFMSLLVPGNNYNWGRRFDRFSKLNWRTTSLPPPLSSPLPLAIPFSLLGPLDPLARRLRQNAL